jgi:hypothetical protein
MPWCHRSGAPRRAPGNKAGRYVSVADGKLMYRLDKNGEVLGRSDRSGLARRS